MDSLRTRTGKRWLNCSQGAVPQSTLTLGGGKLAGVGQMGFTRVFTCDKAAENGGLSTVALAIFPSSLQTVPLL